MVNISSKLKQYINDFGQPSDVILTLRGVSGDLTVRSSDIVQGSLSVDRRSVSGDKLEIGSAISSEFKVSLYNEDGQFNNFTFEGASLFLQVKYTFDDNTVEYVPMGTFTVDDRPRKLSTIQLKALDKMMYFAKPYDTELSFPASLGTMLNDACSKCGITSGVIPSDLINYDYTVDKKPTADGLTYWNVLQMIAELNGVCAWTDENGHLKMGWYKTTDTKITPACRYSSDLQEQDITVTGVATTIGEQQYIYGEEGYCFDLKGNLLIQVEVPEDGSAPDMSKVTPMLQKLATKVKGFKYRPYSCETMSLPHVWQMDAITYTDSDGNSFQSIITNNTWTPSRSKLAGKGKTATLNGYATNPPFTPRQQAIIDSVKRYTDRKVSGIEQGRLDLNEIMANSMGLYQTVKEFPDDSTQYYYHDKPLLEESTTIYTKNAGGFVWTDEGWNNGEPIWKNGFTAQGNAVLNTIATYDLCAGTIHSADGTSYWNLDTGELKIGGYATTDDVKNAIDGIQMPDGSFVYIRYSAYEDGHDMVEVPVPGVHKYTGILSTNNKADQSDYTKYTWSLNCGKDGYTPVKDKDYFDGKPGDNGKTPHIFLRYSDDGKSFTGTSIIPTEPVWENGKYSNLGANVADSNSIRIKDRFSVTPGTSYLVHSGVDGIDIEIVTYSNIGVRIRGVVRPGNNGVFTTQNNETQIKIAVVKNGYSGTLQTSAMEELKADGFNPRIFNKAGAGTEIGAWRGELVTYEEQASEVFSDYTWVKMAAGKELDDLWAAILKNKDSIDLKVGKGADEIISAINLNTTGAKIQARNIDLVIGGKDNVGGQLTVKDANNRVISLFDKDGQFFFPENSDNIMHVSSASWGHGLYYYRSGGKIDAALAFLDDGTKTTARLASGPGDAEIVSFGDDTQAYFAAHSGSEPSFQMQARRYNGDAADDMVDLTGDLSGLTFMRVVGNSASYGVVYDTGNLLIETGLEKITPTQNAYSSGYKGTMRVRTSKGFSTKAFVALTPVTGDPNVVSVSLSGIYSDGSFDVTLWRLNQIETGFRYVVIEPKTTTGIVSVSNFIPQTYTPPLLEEV